MHEIQVSAKFARIPRENLAAFKLVAAEAHAVASLESGTLQYDSRSAADASSRCSVRGQRN
jgi:hypothetical protein